MTSVNGSTTVTGSPSALSETERAQLETSIVAVVNELKNVKKTTSGLDNVKMTEDVLYAALVHAKLSAISKSAAKAFLKELGIRFDRRTERKDSQPIAKALEDSLDTAVKNKALTQSKATTLKSDAFAEAQLDSRKGSLSRTSRAVGMDGISSKVAENAAKNDKNEMKRFTSFEQKIETPEFLSTKAARSQDQHLNRVVNSIAEKKKEVGPTQGPTPPKPVVNEPPVNSRGDDKTLEDDKPVPDRSPLDVPTGPNDMVYKPDSLNDDYPVLIIPVRYANNVVQVTVMDDSGNAVETVSSFSMNKEGRLFARLKKHKKGDLPPKIAFFIKLEDGQFFTQHISDASKPYVRNVG